MVQLWPNCTLISQCCLISPIDLVSSTKSQNQLDIIKYSNFWSGPYRYPSFCGNEVDIFPLLYCKCFLFIIVITFLFCQLLELGQHFQVKGAHVSHVQLAEDWILSSRKLLQTPCSNSAYISALKGAQQFLWAGHEMDMV